MVQAIKDGRIDHLIPFNRTGHAAPAAHGELGSTAAGGGKTAT